MKKKTAKAAAFLAIFVVCLWFAWPIIDRWPKEGQEISLHQGVAGERLTFMAERDGLYSIRVGENAEELKKIGETLSIDSVGTFVLAGHDKSLRKLKLVAKNIAPEPLAQKTWRFLATAAMSAMVSFAALFTLWIAKVTLSLFKPSLSAK